MPARGNPARGWAEYLQATVQAMREKYAQRNKIITDVRDLRLRKIGPTLEPVFRKIPQDFRGPFVGTLIRQGQSLIAADFPKVQRIPIDPADQATSSLIEKWLTAVYPRLGVGTDWWAMITDALAADRTAVWKLIRQIHAFTPQQEEGEPDDLYNKRVDRHRKTSRFPFRVEHVATETYFPVSWDQDGLAEVIEITSREKGPLYDLYQKKLNIGPVTTNPYSGTVEFVEYWNRNRFVYMIDNVVVREGRHTYGIPPYFAANFSTTSIKDPAHDTEGLVDPIVELQKTLDLMITTQMNWAHMAAFPYPLLEPMSEESVPTYEQNPTLRFKAGEALVPPMGYRLTFLQPPPLGSDTSRLIQYFVELIERTSLAEILGGKGQANMSGPMGMMLASYAKSIFGPGMANLAREFNRMAGFMLEQIDTQFAGAPVPVYGLGENKWLELAAKDIDGYYEIRHKLEPILKLERISTAMWLADLQARGAVDMNYLREEGIGLDAPEEMAERVLIEKLEQSSQFANILMEQWIERMRLREQQRQPPTAPPLPVPPAGPAGPGIATVEGVTAPMMPGLPMAAMPMGAPGQGIPSQPLGPGDGLPA